MRHVRKLLKGTDCNTTVEIAYVLVCPDDGSQYQWRMPVGWNKNTEACNRRGGKFFIRVPAPRRRSTSWSLLD